MLRLTLDADAVANIRFTISPLAQANNLLFCLGRRPNAVPRAWRARAVTVIGEQRLDLLAALGMPERGYIPDFLDPVPTAHDNTVEAGIHAIATTPPEQVGREVALALASLDRAAGRAGRDGERVADGPVDGSRTERGSLRRAGLHRLGQEHRDPHRDSLGHPDRGHPEGLHPDGGHPFGIASRRADPHRGRPPERTRIRVILDALGKGEERFAEQVAHQLHIFWSAVLAPHWPRLRARLEADIAHRADTSARFGLFTTLEELDHRILWRDGAVVLAIPVRAAVQATALLLTPTVFYPLAVPSVDFSDRPESRPPILWYPARPADRDAGSRDPAAELVGATRSRILGALAEPRSTADLAGELGLSPATVSYHLQILLRSDLVRRTRQSRHVLYQAKG